MQVAVVGHVEWVEFARVDELPSAGEIVRARESWEEAAGGGAVAAVQLVNLAGSCLFFTALADGGLGGWIRPGGPFRAAPIPGPVADAYGCGDCFAAGVTYGVGRALPVDEAVAIGARCGATVLTSKGPYERQLTGGEL